MKIVITGALGHIGSSLIRELPKFYKNIEVVMIDNLATQRYFSLFNLPQEGNYTFIENDVTCMDLNPIIRNATAVIHLAAITDAANSFEKRDQIELNNLGGTKQVAKACCAEGIPLIFPSSTSVYGVQEGIVDENCALKDLKPQSPYAEVKLKEEYLLKEMALKHGLKVLICRFGTIYGVSPGMRFHTAVNKFCWQAVMGQSLSVWKTAYDQKRPYLDLTDAVQFIVFAINNHLFDGNVYNVVTENLTVREVVNSIQETISKLNIDLVESKIMNQLSYHVSNDKLKNLGFNFQGNIRDGIQKTIELLKNVERTVTV